MASCPSRSQEVNRLSILCLRFFIHLLGVQGSKSELAVSAESTRAISPVLMIRGRNGVSFLLTASVPAGSRERSPSHSPHPMLTSALCPGDALLLFQLRTVTPRQLKPCAGVNKSTPGLPAPGSGLPTSRGDETLASPPASPSRPSPIVLRPSLQGTIPSSRLRPALCLPCTHLQGERGGRAVRVAPSSDDTVPALRAQHRGSWPSQLRNGGAIFLLHLRISTASHYTPINKNRNTPSAPSPSWLCQAAGWLLARLAGSMGVVLLLPCTGCAGDAGWAQSLRGGPHAALHGVAFPSDCRRDGIH